MPVEPFELGKKVGTGKIRIQDTYLVKLVQCSNKVIPGIFDGPKVAWSDKASRSD
jgi:hypothetical protein